MTRRKLYHIATLTSMVAPVVVLSLLFAGPAGYGMRAIWLTLLWVLIGSLSYIRGPKINIGQPHDREYKTACIIGGLLTTVMVIVLYFVDAPAKNDLDAEYGYYV